MRKDRFTTQILCGVALGLAWGLFFGDYGVWIKWLADAFVGLLQMSVLPYVSLSLTVNVGRLTTGEGGRLVRVALRVLMALWAIALVTLAISSLSFPSWQAGSFFSASIVNEPASPDWIELFIPSNPFFSLANNLVPAVVLFSIGLGIALMRIPQKELVLEPMDMLVKALADLNKLCVKLSPIGIFAIVGHTAATISLEQFGLLQGYLIVRGVMSALLCLWILPTILACFTPYDEREILLSCRDMLIAAFIIGSSFVVLPLIVDAVRRLMEAHETEEGDALHSPEYAVQLAYPFPDIGRVLLMVFIPFAAWFYGRSIDLLSYPQLLAVGFVGAFAKPIVTLPLMLDLAELPHDIFNLFLAVGVIDSRFGDLLKSMHLFTFAVLTTSVLSGNLRLNASRLLIRGSLALAVLFVAVLSIRTLLANTFTTKFERQDVVGARHLASEPVPNRISKESTPNPIEGDDTLDRIRKTGIIRIGINPNAVPYSYYNEDNELVGLDIDMAHQMARDLDVLIDFVHYTGDVLEPLRNDHFDLAMSGLEGNVELAAELPEMESYLKVTRALIVPDHLRRKVRSMDHIREYVLERSQPLRIAVLMNGFNSEVRKTERAIGAGWEMMTSKDLESRLEFVKIRDESEFFEKDVADVLITSAESGSAWTLRYPEFDVVKPTDVDVRLPLYYLVAEESRFRDFVNSWLKLKRDDGTIDRLYNYWILGDEGRDKRPRWCVMRDVLHWVE